MKLKELFETKTEEFKSRILKILRMRSDLDETDSSQDAELMKMDTEDALKEIVAWELGDRSWADFFLQHAIDLKVVERVSE